MIILQLRGTQGDAQIYPGEVSCPISVRCLFAAGGRNLLVARLNVRRDCAADIKPAGANKRSLFMSRDISCVAHAAICIRLRRHEMLSIAHQTPRYILHASRRCNRLTNASKKFILFNES